MLTYRALGGNGRLGNQLWQVASTLGLAKAHGHEARLPPWRYQDAYRFPARLFNGPSGHEATDLAGFIPESQRPYLQDLRCIEPVQDELRRWLRPSERACRALDPLVEAHDPASATAVHVRRGDYAETWRGHGMLDRDWYLARWPAGRVLVFSDDPEWCRGNLPGEVVHVEDWIDWHLMAMCKAHVISNSTFAWWAAWIAGGPTTYPDPWFTGLPYGELFPPAWTGEPRNKERT